MILENGSIYTLDPRLPRVRALSLAGPMVVGGVDVREGDDDSVGHATATSTSDHGHWPAANST